MTSKRARRICAKCETPGFVYRGDRWLCVIHNRIDTMQTAARSCGKYVPSTACLEILIAQIVADGMKCPHCGQVMKWHGPKGRLSTATLQHDRSGDIRIICMLCNQRHDDQPDDSFYELPLDHWRCIKCNEIKERSHFPRSVGNGCKACLKKINKVRWAVHGKRWMAQSRKNRGLS